MVIADRRSHFLSPAKGGIDEDDDDDDETDGLLSSHSKAGLGICDDNSFGLGLILQVYSSFIVSHTRQIGRAHV